MNDTNAPILLDIVDYDFKAEKSTVLGQLALGTDGLLTLKHALPDANARLNNMVELINQKPGLHMDTPPQAGSPQFAVATRFVERNSPDFLEALQEHVHKYHGYSLEEL
jgi:hypothetical protein